MKGGLKTSRYKSLVFQQLKDTHEKLLHTTLPWYVGNRGECKREKCHRGVTETLLKKVELTLKRKL